jgi:hypothetical protein
MFYCQARGRRGQESNKDKRRVKQTRKEEGQEEGKAGEKGTNTRGG